MIGILAILLPLLLLLVLIGAAGIGIGFFLHWIIPAIGVDIGTLIGVVTLGWTVYFYTRFLNAVSFYEESLQEADSEFEPIVLKPVRPRRAAKRKK